MSDFDDGNQIATLKADVSKVRSDITDLTHDLINQGKSLIGEKKKKLGVEAHKKAEVLRDRGRQAVATTERLIAERPVPILLGAFSIGFLASKLMSRR